MIVSPEVKKLCRAEITRCLRLARKQWPQLVMERPKLLYDLKGTNAGVALVGDNTIVLNPVLLMENVLEMTQTITAHELAHLVDYELHGEQFHPSGRRIWHGKNFKMIMKVFGRSESTTHSLDTSNVISR